MKVVSVNVGQPRDVEWHGRLVRTSIWKEPVTGTIGVTTLNIDGDRQSDLSVHGGRDKAVYAYPSEHYDDWRRELERPDLLPGAFGENLTTEGIVEDEIRIGDRLRVGSVEFEVVQPRTPCYKLGIRFGRDDLIKRFLDSGRTGFYLAVIREGSLTAGDAIELALPAEHDVTVADVAAAIAGGRADQNLLRRVIAVPALPAGLRAHFEGLLNR